MASSANTDYPSHPFVQPFGDIVLRSSGGDDFRVYKIILSIASPFFEHLLAIPQPPNGLLGEDDTVDGLPVIQLSEDSETIDTMLRFWYPTLRPDVDDPLLGEKVLEATVKFECGAVAVEMCRALLACDGYRPLRLFALALRLRLPSQAVLAARATLRAPLTDMIDTTPDLDAISALKYAHLLRFHRAVSTDAAELLRNSTLDRDNFKYPNEALRSELACWSCDEKALRWGDGLDSCTPWYNRFCRVIVARLREAPLRVSFLEPMFDAKDWDEFYQSNPAGACANCGAVFKLHVKVQRLQIYLREKVDGIVRKHEKELAKALHGTSSA